MKILTVAIAGATFLTTVPAIAAVDDPLQVIYRVSGVFDSGDPTNLGMATTFFCTNFSNVPERVRIVLRPEETSFGPPDNNTFEFGAGQTQTHSTHSTAYQEESALNPGTSYIQGSALILATTLNVHCTVVQVDAAAATPIGIPLTMVRLRPAPNSEE